MPKGEVICPNGPKAIRVRKEKLDPQRNESRAENLAKKLIQFAKNEVYDLMEFTQKENMTVKKLKALAHEHEPLQEALDIAREAIAKNLRAAWREKPHFKDYAHANVEYHDDDYKAFRDHIRAQVTAKATGASQTIHITSDSMGMLADRKEKE